MLFRSGERGPDRPAAGSSCRRRSAPGGRLLDQLAPIGRRLRRLERCHSELLAPALQEAVPDFRSASLTQITPVYAERVPTTAPDARPTRMARADRRQQLLVAARKIFVDRGYHAAGMDEIAEAAGVSKPVLYQHFPGKLELYLALLDLGIHELLASADTAVASTTDNRERVRATMHAYFRFVADRNSAFRLVFESDVMAEPDVRERVDHAHREIAEKIAIVISTDTGLRHQQALLLGSGLQGLAQESATRWLKAEDNSMSLDEAADLVSALAWRGISSFPLSHPPGRQ